LTHNNTNVTCENDYYKITFGGGIASSTLKNKELIIPSLIMNSLGWINPNSLLGGTTITEYDDSIWTDSLINLGQREISYPFTSNINKYELYISSLSEGTRVNLGSHNKDSDHLISSSINYTVNNKNFNKLYLQSNDDYNNTSAFTLTDKMNISSSENLSSSKLLAIPQIIDIKKRVFNDTISLNNLFDNNENQIKLIPFVLDSNETNASHNFNFYGGDYLSLSANESIYFPLKYLGKHEFHIRIPSESDRSKIECSYVKSSSETISLNIASTQSDFIYNYANWYMLGDSSYTLNGNGYIKCTATSNMIIDALYVKSIDYDENDMGEINALANLSDETDESSMQYWLIAKIKNTTKSVKKLFNFGTNVKIKVPKELSNSLDLVLQYIPIVNTTGADSTLNRSLDRSVSDDLATKYKPQLQEITINAGDMSVNLPQVTLMPYGTKDEVKIRTINATDGSAITDVSVTVRFGLDRDDNTIAYSGTTDSNGYFVVTDMPYGQYSFVLSKDGFISTSLNLTVDENTPSSSDLSMSPALTEGQMRIRLSWGANPIDLDSHLVKKTDGTQDYHIYYLSENGTDGDNLDLDDTNGEGPETVTVQNLDNSSVYTYYVEHFEGSSSIKDSSASVKISSGDTELTYYPPNEDGIYWKVFEVENGVVKPCTSNCMYGRNDTSSLVRSLDRNSNEFDIFKNLPNK